MTGRHPPPETLQELSALFAAGRHAELEAASRRWLAQYPDDGQLWKALGIACAGLGKRKEALAAKERTVALLPRDPEAHVNFGNALAEERRGGEAEQHFRAALALDAAQRNALKGLSTVLCAAGRFREAAECCERRCALQPDSAAAFTEWGHALRDAQLAPQARAAYERALALDARSLDAMSSLAYILADMGLPVQAERMCRAALAIDPKRAALHSNLGLLLKNQGRHEEALACYRNALTLDPDHAASQSNFLLTLNHVDSVTPEDMKAHAATFGRWAAQRASPADRPRRTRAAGEPLRVGLVSGDLRNHPVGFFLEAALAHWPVERVALYGYPTVAFEDDLTQRIRGRFTQWRSLRGLDDRAAAQLIAQDGIDVLLDLSGHTANNRLGVFACRPAPVQASWLGYFATTGLAEMDWIIADGECVPPENDRHFTERVWRLPRTRLCFSPPHDAPAVAPAPAMAQGYITFGCFQNLGKITDAVLALWSQVLQAVPGARLRVQNRALAEPAAQETFRQRLVRAGIAPERADLHGLAPRQAYLQAHAQVDIILDTFPYPGGTTTCEALWMGVPTITLAGSNLLSRQGQALLAAAGLHDWIAASHEGYVTLAATRAGDIPSLAATRASLRERVQASALFDAPRFATELAEALREMAASA